MEGADLHGRYRRSRNKNVIAPAEFVDSYLHYFKKHQITPLFTNGPYFQESHFGSKFDGFQIKHMFEYAPVSESFPLKVFNETEFKREIQLTLEYWNQARSLEWINVFYQIHPEYEK